MSSRGEKNQSLPTSTCRYRVYRRGIARGFYYRQTRIRRRKGTFCWKRRLGIARCFRGINCHRYGHGGRTSTPSGQENTQRWSFLHTLRTILLSCGSPEWHRWDSSTSGRPSLVSHIAMSQNLLAWPGSTTIFRKSRASNLTQDISWIVSSESRERSIYLAGSARISARVNHEDRGLSVGVGGFGLSGCGLLLNCGILGGGY